MAEQASEHRAELRRRANIDRAERGEWSTSNRPFGYTQHGQPLEPEATAFRQAVADVLAGKSIRSIAKAWNADGLTTTRGTAWDGARLREVLGKPRYAALRVHQGKIVGPGTWTPLIKEDAYHALQTLLTDPARNSGRTSYEQKHLGSGLYVCGVCGAKMQSGHNDKVLIYRCRTQRHLSRAAKPVDDMVQATILKWFADQNAHQLRDSAVDMVELSTQRLAVQGKLEKLGAMYASDTIGDDEFATASRNLRARLTAVDNQLLAATGTSPASTLIAASQAAHAAHDDAATMVADMWQNMTVTQRAEAINEVAVVTILPAKRLGPGFDPTCIDIARRKAGSTPM